MLCILIFKKIINFFLKVNEGCTILRNLINRSFIKEKFHFYYTIILSKELNVIDNFNAKFFCRTFLFSCSCFWINFYAFILKKLLWFKLIFILITDDINMQFSYELEKKFLTWTRNPECQGSSPIQVRNLESLW